MKAVALIFNKSARNAIALDFLKIKSILEYFQKFF